MNLNKREIATILAALRHWQNTTPPVPWELSDIFYKIEPLTTNEINDLCQRINFADWKQELANEPKKKI